MSSGGAAVEFPAARADATGVIGTDAVGDGTGLGTDVVVGGTSGVAEQALKSIKNRSVKRSSFIIVL